jgi:hypothetical protein
MFAIGLETPKFQHINSCIVLVLVVVLHVGMGEGRQRADAATTDHQHPTAVSFAPTALPASDDEYRYYY